MCVRVRAYTVSLCLRQRAHTHSHARARACMRVHARYLAVRERVGLEHVGVGRLVELDPLAVRPEDGFDDLRADRMGAADRAHQPHNAQNAYNVHDLYNAYDVYNVCHACERGRYLLIMQCRQGPSRTLHTRHYVALQRVLVCCNRRWNTVRRVARTRHVGNAHLGQSRRRNHQLLRLDAKEAPRVAHLCACACMCKGACVWARACVRTPGSSPWSLLTAPSRCGRGWRIPLCPCARYACVHVCVSSARTRPRGAVA